MTDDLDLLRDDWKQMASEVPPDLVERTDRLARAQYRAAAGEVLASIFVLVVSVWLLIRNPIAPMLAFALAMCLFVGVWLTYFFTVRAGSWRRAGASVREFTQLTRRLHTVEVQWARFARAGTIALTAFLLVWSPWLVITRWEVYGVRPWRGLVGFGIAACILLATWIWNRRKLARAIESLSELEARTRDLED